MPSPAKSQLQIGVMTTTHSWRTADFDVEDNGFWLQIVVVTHKLADRILCCDLDYWKQNHIRSSINRWGIVESEDEDWIHECEAQLAHNDSFRFEEFPAQSTIFPHLLAKHDKEEDNCVGEKRSDSSYKREWNWERNESSDEVGEAYMTKSDNKRCPKGMR